MAQQISIALTGDVMLGRLVNAKLKHFGPAYPWGDILPLLRKADLAIINLECVIAGSGRPWSRWPKVFHFRAVPEALDSLLEAGIDGVTLANNHVLDYEEEALIEMLTRLEQSGIAYTGAGRNLAEARRPMLLETEGLKVGVLAFTDNEPGWAATEISPGVNWLDVSTSDAAIETVRRSIDSARRAGADVVIFTNHWGPNMVERPPGRFRNFAHAVMDAGADLYFGHSAHLFQGIEIYKGKPIIYDAGDFVDDYAVDPRLRNDYGLLFRTLFEDRSLKRIELIPAFISDCRVNLACGSTRQAIIDRIRRLSEEMGSSLRHEVGRMWIDCGPSAN